MGDHGTIRRREERTVDVLRHDADLFIGVAAVNQRSIRMRSDIAKNRVNVGKGRSEFTRISVALATINNGAEAKLTI